MRFETEAEEKRLSLRLLGPLRQPRGAARPVQDKEGARASCLAAEGEGTQGERRQSLWPESEKRNARADLRAVLHKLRKTLKEESAHDGVARFFVIESNRLELEPREIELDLEVFEAASFAARRNLAEEAAADGGRRELIGRLQGSGLYREFMEGSS